MEREGNNIIINGQGLSRTPRFYNAPVKTRVRVRKNHWITSATVLFFGLLRSSFSSPHCIYVPQKSEGTEDKREEGGVKITLLETSSNRSRHLNGI